jgi:hypothetical protein
MVPPEHFDVVDVDTEVLAVTRAMIAHAVALRVHTAHHLMEPF